MYLVGDRGYGIRAQLCANNTPPNKTWKQPKSAPSTWDRDKEREERGWKNDWGKVDGVVIEVVTLLLVDSNYGLTCGNQSPSGYGQWIWIIFRRIIGWFMLADVPQLGRLLFQ